LKVEILFGDNKSKVKMGGGSKFMNNWSCSKCDFEESTIQAPSGVKPKPGVMIVMVLGDVLLVKAIILSLEIFLAILWIFGCIRI
jgi:hypothetical protein